MNGNDAWFEQLVPPQGFGAGNLWEAVVILLLLLAASRLFPNGLSVPSDARGSLAWSKRNIVFLLVWGDTLILYLLFSLAFGWAVPALRLFVILGFIWILIGLISSYLKDRFTSESVAGLLYVATTGVLISQVDGAVEFFTGLKFSIGSFSLSMGGLVTGIAAFVIAIWVGLALSGLAETQIRNVPRLSASLKVLIGKILRIAFIIVAAIVALGSMGIDLSALTVLSGAIGLGLGFGLQKVVSNFISGIILLLDNSIKPGDVIEIEDTYGWINNLRARYASIITRDGTEHLIPNEDLITQKVINWSFTNELVRMKVPIGVAYKEDPHRCIEIISGAAGSIERVLENPGPVCLLKGFGDSSVDLELRFWISDPSNGISNVKSKVLLAVWDALKANDIEIPFPQRDVHLKTDEVMPVKRTDPDPD